MFWFIVTLLIRLFARLPAAFSLLSELLLIKSLHFFVTQSSKAKVRTQTQL